MDQLDIASLSLTSKPSNQNGKFTWPDGPSKKQYFSIPENIIHCMIKNPSSPEVYLKLAKSCKYFFEENPILIVKRIEFHGTIICENDNAVCKKKNDTCCITIDSKKLSSKIWLTKLFADHGTPLLLYSKLYGCENAVLSLWNVKWKLEQFKFCASKFQKFRLFDYVKITDNDKKNVMLEKLLESIPIVTKFTYSFNKKFVAASTSTMKNISKLNNLSNLDTFELFMIPVAFPIEDLEAFIKDHKDTKFWFTFRANLSDSYKQQLGALVDTVIASGPGMCGSRFR